MKAYTSPKVTELGSVQQLTLGLATGTRLDASLPVGSIATFLST